ncbi:hypothetical protein KR222_008634, partial [Zaprionus bogoriensis]
DTNSDYVLNILRQSKAAEIASFMNTSADPCEDFYEFACGKWDTLNKATTSKLTTGLLEHISDGFDRKLKNLLQNIDPKKVPVTDAKVKNYYTSCMKVKKIDVHFRNQLKSFIEEFGTMPALQGDTWSNASFDWVDTVAKIARNYGIVIIIGTEVNKDFANNTKNAMYISQQEFPLETRTMYLENNTANYRQAYMSGIAKLFQTYLGIQEPVAKKTAKEILDFEVELAKGLESEKEDHSLAELSELMTLSEMQRLYAPELDVKKLVNISQGVIVEKVYRYNGKYLKNLVEVLQRTDKRNVANYIFFRLLEDFFFTPGKTLAEQKDECVAQTKKHFSKILDNLIFREYNNNDTSDDINNIWSELKTVFREKLQSDPSLNWISYQTRQLAIEKLDAMTMEINYFPLDKLIKEFSDLDIDEDNFVSNNRHIMQHEALQNRDQFYKPVKPLEMGSLLSFTPANILMENIIKLPVALLQPYYLWGPSYPNAIKFGSLATLIAHELIHGFDNDGRDFDKRGNIKTWWDTNSTANFIERQGCFKEHYGNYTYNGKPLPKSNEQAENIADNGGLQLSYDAYLRWLAAQEASGKSSKHLDTERLPSLEYSNMQLFFISYAQVWCNDILPAARNFQVATDQHVPGEFRVIGPISNFEKFAKEFQCKPGSRMNPLEKCKIY